MNTYAIGDIQGCLSALEKLLQTIEFDPKKDTLWFTGDLVNRGPQSLDTLRFIQSLGEKHIVVLGNHDLHLLAVAHGAAKLRQSDTLDEILQAPDKHDLLDWLRHKKLLHYDEATKFVMTHAGLAPTWTLSLAQQLANEVEDVLRSDRINVYLANMYGNLPDRWDPDLQETDRWRCITNYFTRMRFCHANGRLDLTYKGGIENKPQELIPWFDVPDRLNANEKIIFGHWAALDGKTDVPHLFPLDTGCVWGNCLTALRLGDGLRFSVKCGN